MVKSTSSLSILLQLLGSYPVHDARSSETKPFANDIFQPPTEYLFLDEKRKLKIVVRVKKQIIKFDLTKEDFGFVYS